MNASQILVTFLVNAAWQIPVITAIAGVGSKLMRRAPAGYRHLVWVAALGLSLGIPLLSTLGPGQNREAAKSNHPAASLPVAKAVSPRWGFPSGYGDIFDSFPWLRVSSGS